MSFTRKLLHWYGINKRDLPWRRTSDPYLVWLSEIILQQTRIEQGLPYYERFANAFPTVADLANAQEQDVLKLWQGLGYYSRARNMHHAARYIALELEGRFPSTYIGLRALKGVGDYTAAAIGSIAFNLPDPVVDGNVLRFFSRHFGITAALNTAQAKQSVYTKAATLIPAEAPGDFNQAMMEFGATYCKPAGPDCVHCIFSTTCFAFLNDRVSELPVKTKPATQRTRYFHYLVLRSSDGEAIAMKKREPGDIWEGLYDFPLIETPQPTSFKALISHPQWNGIMAGHRGMGARISGLHRHLLTHQVIRARFYEWVVDRASYQHLLWIDVKNLDTIPVPRLIERYLHTLK